VLRSLAPPTPLAIRQSVQRFVNTLASVFIGRKYLSLSAELVPTLINALILEDDPVSRPHLLGNFRTTLGNVQFCFYIYISVAGEYYSID